VQRRVNWLFGGVYGTLLASGLLAGSYNPDYPTPLTDAMWIAITMATTVIGRGYAQHVSMHTAETGMFWGHLGRKVTDGWPLFVACLPTVALALVSGTTHWAEGFYTLIGLGMNVVLLFGWGIAAARTGGHNWRETLGIGCGNATLGAFIMLISAVIK